MDRRLFAKRMVAFVTGLTSSGAEGSAAVHLGARWTRDRFNVRAFGALGNGRSDDSASIASALLEASRVAGTVVIPSGVYCTSKPLRIASGVTVEGEGQTSILAYQGTDNVVLTCKSSRDVTILGITLTGTFAHGIVIEHSDAVRVERCGFIGASVPRHNMTAAVLIVGSKDVTIQSCHLRGNGTEGERESSDIQCDGTGQCSSDIRILDNDCLSRRVTTNIRCYDTARTTIRHNRVSGARCKNASNNGYGILLYETRDLEGSCYENIVDRNSVSGTEGSGIYLNRSHRSFVRGNTIWNVALKQDDESLPVGGIALNHSEFVEITDNTIANVERAGISLASILDGVGHVKVLRNTVSGTGGFGIHLRGALTDVVVSNNRLSDVAGGIGSRFPQRQRDVHIVANDISKTREEKSGIVLTNASLSTVRDNVLSDCGSNSFDVTFRDEASEASNNRVLLGGVIVPGSSAAIRVVRQHQ